VTAMRVTPSTICSVFVFALASIAGIDRGAVAAPPLGGVPTGDARPGPAAGEARPKSEARRRAAAAMKRGMKLIAAKQYDAAIAAIASAHELDPKSEHLYNLGVAHHLKGDRSNALAWYQKFLAAGSKNRPLVAAAKGYAAQLTAELEGEAAAAAEREAEAKKARAAEEAEAARRRAAGQEAERRAREQAERVERERLARERDRWRTAAGAGRGKRALGASLLIAGGAALGAGIVAGFEARSAHRELDSLGEGDTWTVSRDWLHDRGESSQTRAILFSAAGASLAAAGALLYYLGERDNRRGALADERRAAVTPVVSDGGAGLAVVAPF